MKSRHFAEMQVLNRRELFTRAVVAYRDFWRKRNRKIPGRLATRLTKTVRRGRLLPSLRYAQEISWREDNRRVANGEQTTTVAALAMRCGPSVDFSGYWQRHVRRAA